MLYLTSTTITNVDLAHYGISRAKDWVSVECGTSCLDCHAKEWNVQHEIRISYFSGQHELKIFQKQLCMIVCIRNSCINFTSGLATLQSLLILCFSQHIYMWIWKDSTFIQLYTAPAILRLIPNTVAHKSENLAVGIHKPDKKSTVEVPDKLRKQKLNSNTVHLSCSNWYWPGRVAQSVYARSTG